MEIEAVLCTELLADVGVAALVEDRILPNVIPADKALPAVAYQRISTNRDMAHDGPTNFTMTRVQYTCTGETYASAKAVARAVRLALHGTRGRLGPAGQELKVHRVSIENDFDGYNQESGEQTVRLDAVVHYQEV